jgi:hypothetical protein
MQGVSTEDHQTGETKQARWGALNRQIRPLTLGLDAHMGTSFLKGHLYTPALYAVFDDLFCRLGGVGGTDRFGGLLA